MLEYSKHILDNWILAYTRIARPREAGATSPRLKYSHYSHRTNPHLEPASHYSHRIIIRLKIFKISNNVNITNTSNNASNYLHKNMQIMQVITHITCNTRIICIKHVNNASHCSHYLYYLHYSNVWVLSQVIDLHYSKYLNIQLKLASHYSHRLDWTRIELCEASKQKILRSDHA